MPSRLHPDHRPFQRVLAVILLIAAIALPGYLVLAPRTTFSEVSLSE